MNTQLFWEAYVNQLIIHYIPCELIDITFPSDTAISISYLYRERAIGLQIGLLLGKSYLNKFMLQTLLT